MTESGDAEDADRADAGPSIPADPSPIPAFETAADSSPLDAFAPDALAQFAEIRETHFREDSARRVLRNYVAGAWSTLGASWGATLLCSLFVGAGVEVFAVAALVRVIFLYRRTTNLDAEEKSAWNRKIGWLTVCVVLTGVLHAVMLSLWALGTAVAVQRA